MDLDPIKVTFIVIWYDGVAWFFGFGFCELISCSTYLAKTSSLNRRNVHSYCILNKFRNVKIPGLHLQCKVEGFFFAQKLKQANSVATN